MSYFSIQHREKYHAVEKNRCKQQYQRVKKKVTLSLLWGHGEIILQIEPMNNSAKNKLICEGEIPLEKTITAIIGHFPLKSTVLKTLDTARVKHLKAYV